MYRSAVTTSPGLEHKTHTQDQCCVVYVHRNFVAGHQAQAIPTACGQSKVRTGSICGVFNALGRSGSLAIFLYDDIGRVGTLEAVRQGKGQGSSIGHHVLRDGSAPRRCGTNGLS